MMKSSCTDREHTKGSVPPPIKRESNLQLWKTHKQESVYFQREAQVNFWTVLGGLALGALLTQLPAVLEEVQNSQWYLLLFVVSSILILANSWVQTTWGSLVLKWPISITTTVLMVFGMFSQSIQCLLVTNPSGWLAASAGLILCTCLHQWYFERSGAWRVFPMEFARRFKRVNTLYFMLVFVCMVGALQLRWYASPIAEMSWGFAALIFSILALLLQHRGMNLEKKALGIP